LETLASRSRLRARVTGTVQGVGFRPFVYRLAEELGLAGWVLNDTRGVLIEAEGASPDLARFLERLRTEAPPLAAIEAIVPEEASPRGEAGFRILESSEAGRPAAPVSPDAATCPDCLRELRDPRDRRFRYPFVNCTNCGPRFTIVEGVPYDRPLTTMAGFEMCALCRAEYEDPLDRRFHAQPTACPRCGPAVRLIDADGGEAPVGDAGDAVAAAAAALEQGAIVAVKGLGGYHLACRADDDAAVAALRSRKHREERPFALLAADVAAARRLVDLGAEEEALLISPARPIVLAPRRPDAAVAAAVAPHAPEFGVMLPYSPLHHLLAGDFGVPLVLTSGNVSDEPIAYRDEDALRRLRGNADLFLTHDRPIHMRTDDSVLRVVGVGGRRPLPLRRSRGYVPGAIELPLECASEILACGAEQKNAFCLAKGRRAWVGHHIGDLKNLETLASFSEGIAHFERLFAVEPQVCAHDLHPDYLSTRYALERGGVELVGVQHHHAHLAACLAEHGELGEAVGAIYDGTGLGPDGVIWGGELLRGGVSSFERAGHLTQVTLPGGEAAIREPWRMACAWLTAAGDSAAPARPTALADAVDGRDWRNCARVAAGGFGSPATTSMGRLFDAVGAICGAAPRVAYEGQAAVELEAMADPAERGRYEIDGLEAGPAVLALVEEIEDGIAPATVAARFHNTIAAATAEACSALASSSGTEVVVLSGGVFQNRLLLEAAAALLTRSGLRVLVPEVLPPNDGGIAFGQVAVAAATLG
jgi:hydrogenase maturation protein HypF